MFVPCTPVPGALTVNAGDQIQILTNGIFRSCVHRVANPDPSDATARLSLVLFTGPRPDARSRRSPRSGRRSGRRRRVATREGEDRCGGGRAAVCCCFVVFLLNQKRRRLTTPAAKPNRLQKPPRRGVAFERVDVVGLLDLGDAVRVRDPMPAAGTSAGRRRPAGSASGTSADTAISIDAVMFMCNMTR